MKKIPIPAEFQAFLSESGLVKGNQLLIGKPLDGGISSEIWLIDLPTGPICIKRALSTLRVTADWHAPIERNRYEVAWIQLAAKIIPGQVLTILAHDRKGGMFAMPYLAPSNYRLWKEELLTGNVDLKFASSVGTSLAQMHLATMEDPKIARMFATDKIFYSIRLEPYLEATARVHVDVAEKLYDLARNTKHTKKALVHGDISPKNIMVSPDGPIFLDAECAWYGDPAFDLAFCLNHFLLKCLYRPNAREAYLDSFENIIDCYLRTMGPIHAEDIEKRTAHLIPGLFLARIDGKSPVEYITRRADKNLVRKTAKLLLLNPVSRLRDITNYWKTELKIE